MVEAAAIEKMAATLKGLAAARAASGGAWKDAGDRSAAHHLARTTGTSVGQAIEAIETARRLEKLPGVAAAARAGELSAQQAAAVSDAAALDASAEARLLEKARTSSLGELREECARTKAAARPDAEARRRAIHAERFLRSYTDAEGAWNLRMRDNPEVGAEVMAAIEAIRDRLFRDARTRGAPRAVGGLRGRRPGRAGPDRRGRGRAPQRPFPGQDHRAGGPARPAAGLCLRGRGVRAGRLRAGGRLRRS